MSYLGAASYQVPGGPGPKRPPGVVTVASLLLYLCALFVAAMGAASVINTLTNQDVLPTALPPGMTIGPGVIQVAAVLSGVIFALFAGAFLTLGVLMRKGRNPARILAFVLTGVVALCCGCLDALAGVGQVAPQLDPSTNPLGQPSATAPGWYSWTYLGLNVTVVLACVAIIVLLSVPASNDFFRKESETWVPPNWTAGYAYPEVGYPQPPTIPQYPYQQPLAPTTPAVPPVPEVPPVDPDADQDRT
jgi:hypothetical protein